MRELRNMLLIVLCLVLALGALGAWADQETPVKYVLTLSTETTALPMAIPNIPNLPNIPGLGDLFKPHRTITGQAVYPHQAVAPIFVTVPTDLKLKDNKLVLEVPQPVTAGPGGEGGGEGGQTQPGKMEFVSKLYWHPDIAEGPEENDVTIDTSMLPQPKRGQPPVVPGADWQSLQEQMARTASGSAPKIPDQAVGHGDYTLNTGSLTIPLDGFLPPVKVTTPAALASVNLPDGIEVKWDPVPGARGFILHAMSMTRGGDKTTVIRWVSTTVKPPVRVQSDYEQETTIADDLANGILLPAETVSCKVPAGLFPEKPDMFTLDVIAVGNDFYDQANGPTLFGKIRAKWTGMKMGAMPARPGGGGEG